MTTDKDKGIVGSATTMTSNAPPRSAARSLHAPNEPDHAALRREADRRKGHASRS